MSARPPYSWRSVARALEQLLAAGLVSKLEEKGVYQIAVPRFPHVVVRVEGGVDALLEQCFAEGLLEIAPDGEIALSEAARDRSRSSSTWPAASPTPTSAPEPARPPCPHERVRYLRAVARHGEADLIFGAELVSAGRTGTALAEWCEDCGAVGLAVDGPRAWVVPELAVSPPTPAADDGVARAVVHANAGLLAEGEPLEAIAKDVAALGGSLIVDAEQLEAVAVRELDAACNNVARAAALLEEVTAGNAFELVDHRPQGARDAVALVYAEEWTGLQDALKAWQDATRVFLALLPRKPARARS